MGLGFNWKSIKKYSVHFVFFFFILLFVLIYYWLLRFVLMISIYIFIHIILYFLLKIQLIASDFRFIELEPGLVRVIIDILCFQYL